MIGASAVLKGTTKGSTANLEGLLSIENIPDGKQIIVFSYIGYETKSDTFSFPLTHTEPFQIELNPKAGELEEVVISSTRSTRTIQEIPTRMKFIGLEELGEKANMKAGVNRMLISESTGFHKQFNSSKSGNDTIDMLVILV